MPFRSGYTREDGVPADPPAANWPLDRARSDTARLHPGSTPLIRAFRRFYKLFRSGFFGARIRIYHGNFASLAFAGHLSRFTPATRLLPAKTSFQQNGANGVFTHFWQAIRGFAQSLTQGFQRPGGCAILLRVWFPSSFPQNPFALSRIIFDCGTSSMPRLNTFKPSWLNRFTKLETASPDLRPDERAASV